MSKMTDERIADNGKTIDHIADDGKKVLTDEEIYPPLENITLEQAYEDYAKATKEMKDTLLNEITKLREQLEHLQGERADTIRAEAIKEYIGKLLINLEYDYCSYSQELITLIKDTEKEMVGEGK